MAVTSRSAPMEETPVHLSTPEGGYPGTMTIQPVYGGPSMLQWTKCRLGTSSVRSECL